VVNADTGIPGPGFTAWPGKLEDAYEEVFNFHWDTISRPFSNLEQIKESQPAGPTPEIPDFNVPDEKIIINGRGPYQYRFRKMMLREYKRECAMCNTKLKSLLVASHIVPWALDIGNRLNPRNGILLCRTHDSLFESGHIEVGTDFSISVVEIDPPSMGEAVSTFLSQFTAKKLRAPSSSSKPEKQFLEWRLANNPITNKTPLA